MLLLLLLLKLLLLLHGLYGAPEPHGARRQAVLEAAPAAAAVTRAGGALPVGGAGDLPLGLCAWHCVR